MLTRFYHLPKEQQTPERIKAMAKVEGLEEHFEVKKKSTTIQTLLNATQKLQENSQENTTNKTHVNAEQESQKSLPNFKSLAEHIAKELAKNDKSFASKKQNNIALILESRAQRPDNTPQVPGNNGGHER